MAFTAEQKREYRQTPEAREKQREYNRLWRERNPNYYKRYTDSVRNRGAHRKKTERNPQANIKYKQSRRLLAINMLGGCCSKCGFSDVRALQIDHIVPLGLVGEKRKDTTHEVLTAADLTNYQLLCANCHSIKTHENKDRTSHLRRKCGS